MKTQITIIDDGEKSIITIIPVTLSLPGGVRYATGQYKLKKGDMGIGTITFDDDMAWDFDGIDELDLTHIQAIADFIIAQNKPASAADKAVDGEVTITPPIKKSIFDESHISVFNGLWNFLFPQKIA